MPGPHKAGTGVVLRFALSHSRDTRIRRVPRHRSISGETNVARIAGVNLPTNKRVVIALQYIHGIGPKTPRTSCARLTCRAERRVSQLTDAEVLQIREMIDRDYMVEGDLRREVSAEHQAPDGSRLLSRPAPSQGPAGSRSAHPHQCAHPQGSAKTIAGKKKSSGPT